MRSFLPRKGSGWVCRIELCVPGRVRAEKPARAGRWDQPFGKTRVGSCRAQDGDAAPGTPGRAGRGRAGFGELGQTLHVTPSPSSWSPLSCPSSGQSQGSPAPPGLPLSPANRSQVPAGRGLWGPAAPPVCPAVPRGGQERAAHGTRALLCWGWAINDPHQQRNPNRSCLEQPRSVH